MDDFILDHKDLERAIYFATTKHAGQTRRNKVMPYIVHPIEVMKTLYDWGVREVELLCAAVLHDTLEDTKTTREEIANGWGSKVLQYVEEVSKLGVDDATIEEKVSFLRSFQEHNKSTGGGLLKLADRWCNIKDFRREDKREWFPSYYALQAYPICTWFYKNIYREDGQDIGTLYGLHIRGNAEMVVDEIVGVICRRYTEDVIELIYNRGKYEATHDKLMEILKLREKGQTRKVVKPHERLAELRKNAQAGDTEIVVAPS